MTRDRQGKTTSEVPTWPRIAWYAVGGLIAAVATGWVMQGDSGREALGALACGVWAGTFIGRAIEDAAKRWLARRPPVVLSGHTGMWTDEGGHLFTVRISPEVNGWYVRGWVTPYMNLVHEELWFNADEVAALITAAEAEGYSAADDVGTRAVRSLLRVEREVWATEPVRSLEAYRNRLKPGPY